MAAMGELASGDFGVSRGIAGKGTIRLPGIVLAILGLMLATGAAAESYSYLRKWPSGPNDIPLYNPRAVDFDADGYRYIIEGGFVIKVAPNGDVVATWGDEGQPDASFRTPSGIAVGPTGDVYVAETLNGHRIQKFSGDGEFITKWGSEGSEPGQFDYPSDLVLSTLGEVYVADARNGRVQVFDSDGNYLRHWDTPRNSTGGYGYVYGIALDSAGNVYLTDAGFDCVYKYSAEGELLLQWGSFGSGPSRFQFARGIDVDASGYVYVVDYSLDRVQKFTSEGVYVRMWGIFDGPMDLTVSNSGTVCIADMGNHRIQEFGPHGALHADWATIGTAESRFNLPIGIEVNAEGNVYVGDWNNDRVQKFSAAGEFLLAWGEQGDANGEFQSAGDIAFDSLGNVYVTDTGNDRIQKFSADGVFIRVIGTSGSGDGQLDNPRSVAIDSRNIIYVADMYNDRIVMFGQHGAYAGGWGSFGSSEGRFQDPAGVEVSADGHVYVADRNNYRIQKFTSDGVFVAQWGSEGSGDGQFARLSGIEIDAAGDVYVSDFDNHRIQKFTADGEFITKWGSYGLGNSEFNQTGGVAVSSSGHVYITDYANSRIMQYALSLPAPVIRSPNGGEDYFTRFDDPVLISGTCDPSATAIYVNGSPDGVTYTPGNSTWSYLSDALGTGPNTFTVRAYNGGSESPNADAITITLDEVQPRPVMSAVCPTSSNQIGVSVDFGEPVVGFNVEDIVDVVNGTASDFTGEGRFYYFNITAKSEGSVSARIPSSACTDLAGNPNQVSLVFYCVYDATPPTATLMSSAPDVVTGPISVTVTLSETSTDFGAEDIVTTFCDVIDFSGSGASYEFTVVPLQQGYFSVWIPEGGFTDSAHNPNLASSGLSRSYDTLGPIIVLESEASAIVNTPIAVSVTMNEPSSDFGQDDILVVNAELSDISGSGSSFSFLLQPLDQGPFSAMVPEEVCTDAVGNPNTASNILTRSYDSVGPGVSLSSATAEVVNAPISVLLELSEPTANLEAEDIVVENALAEAFNGSGDSYSFMLIPLAQGPFTVVVAAGVCSDALGNPNRSSGTLQKTYDSIGPNVLLTSSSAETVNGAVTVSVLLSEPSATFAIEDLAVINGTLSAFSGDGTAYSFVLTPQEQGAFSVQVAAGACADSLGNPSSASNIMQWAFDSIGPTIALTTDAAETVNAPIRVEIVLSEPSIDFTIEDLLMSHADPSQFSGNGSSYSFLLTPRQQGAFSVRVPSASCSDALGNPNTASNSLERNYDSEGPEISLESMAGDFVNADVVVEVLLNEPGSGIDMDDIGCNNAVASGLEGTGTAYRFTLTPETQGPFSAAIAAGACTDAFGNPNSASKVFSRTFDSVAPAVNLSSPAPHFTNTSPIPAEILFSEPVTGFTAEDIATENATVEALTGEGARYTAALAPVGYGTVVAGIAAGACTDRAGNPNAASGPLVRFFDNVAPVVSVDRLITEDSTPPLAGTVDDESAAIIVTVAGQTAAASVLGHSWHVDDGVLAPLSPGTYDVRVLATDPAGNIGVDGSIDELQIEEPELPQEGLITASLPSLLWIAGVPLQLRAPEGTNYRWYCDEKAMAGDGYRVTGVTSRSLDLKQLAISDSGHYCVRYDNGRQKSLVRSFDFTLAVRSKPVVDHKITASQPAEFWMSGIGLTLTAPEVMDYEWRKDGAPLAADAPRLSGVNSRRLVFAPLALSDSGVYSVFYNDGLSNGPVESDVFVLVVQPNPQNERLPVANPVALLLTFLTLGLAAVFVLRNRREGARRE